MTETELSFCEVVGIETFLEIWGMEVYRGWVPV